MNDFPERNQDFLKSQIPAGDDKGVGARLLPKVQGPGASQSH